MEIINDEVLIDENHSNSDLKELKDSIVELQQNMQITKTNIEDLKSDLDDIFDKLKSLEARIVDEYVIDSKIKNIEQDVAIAKTIDNEEKLMITDSCHKLVKTEINNRENFTEVIKESEDFFNSFYKWMVGKDWAELKAHNSNKLEQIEKDINKAKKSPMINLILIICCFGIFSGGLFFTYNSLKKDIDSINITQQKIINHLTKGRSK